MLSLNILLNNEDGVSLSLLTPYRSGRRKAFELEILHRLDKNLMFFFPSTVADRWVGLRLEFVGSLVVLFASILAIHSSGITAGAVGLSITYAMQVLFAPTFVIIQ